MKIKDLEKVFNVVKRRYTLTANVALLNLPIMFDESISTAAVVSKNVDGILVPEKIIFNEKFMDSLSFEEQVFVAAHETFHIVFKHFKRSLLKPEIDIKEEYENYEKLETDEKKRKIKLLELKTKYYRFWNIATDACINAMLLSDNIKMPKDIINPVTNEVMNFVNIEGAINKNAETIYEELKKENNNENNNENSNDEKEYKGIDSHEKWMPNDFKSEEISNDIDDEEQEIPNDILKKELKNRKEQIINEYKNKTSILLKKELNKGVDINAKKRIPWTSILISTNPEQLEEYTHRRDSKYNIFPRITEVERNSKIITEVVIDCSNSVSDDLIKQFLNEVYNLYFYSKIRIGFFGGKFYGFKEINTKEDILNLKIVRDEGLGTNYEAVALSFSKSYNTNLLNKIVFTDGVLDNLENHKQKTKVDDIIWIVFGSKMNFKPIGGKIIKVNENDIKYIDNLYKINKLTLRK